MARERQPQDLTLYTQGYPYGPGAHGGDPFGSPYGQQGHKNESLWKVIDDRLRGRWKWMIVCGLLLAVKFGIIGYMSTVPRFRSTAIVQVETQLPVIIKGIDDMNPWDTNRYVATQVHFIQTRRVLEEAMKDPALAALPGAQDPSFIKQVEDGLIVEWDGRNDLIHVSYESEQPQAAMAITNAVIHSYDRIFASSGSLELNQKMEVLKDLKRKQEIDLREKRKQIDLVRAKYGTTNLSEMQTSRQGELRKLEDNVEEMTTRLRLSEGSREELAKLPDPTPADLEQADADLRGLGAALRRAEIDWEVVKSKFGPLHQDYREAERHLNLVRKLYTDKLDQVMADYKRGGGLVIRNTDGKDSVVTSPQQLSLRLRQDNERLDRLRKETQALSADVSLLSQLEWEESDLKSSYDETNNRIKTIETETPVLARGRIRIAQEGFMPLGPYSDGRRKRCAIGVGLGLLGSFGVFFLVGTIDRRAFGAAQLKTSGVALPPFLGVLPDLGKSLSDPTTSEIAAHCVHQIRNQIESLRDPRDGYVMAVTSPHQGDGKTSIVLSLGWSYAAAGFRTLLVDCDLVGRSLTRQLGMIGREGMKELLLTGRVNGEVSPLQVERLSAIPVGVDTRSGPETVRRSDLERLFSQVREKFDVIIVDTGPILGSLESVPVAAAADGVIVTVRRGRSRAGLDECVARLDTVGGNCVGVILNGAGRADCNRYVSEASLASDDRARHHEPRDMQPASAVMNASRNEQNALLRAMESMSRPGRDES